MTGLKLLGALTAWGLVCLVAFFALVYGFVWVLEGIAR